MKKALIFILSAALILSALVSCGAEPPKAEPTKPLAQSTQTDTPAASTPAPEPEQKPEQKAAAPKETPEPEPEPTPEPEPEPEETPEETQPPEPQLFTEVNETVYVIDTDSLNTRSGPGTSYDTIGSLAWGESTTRIGVGIDGTEAEGWSIVKLSDGSIVYMSSKYLSTTKPEAKSSGNSGGSNSKVSKAESKPSTASNQEAPAESSGGGVDSDGLTEQERREIAILQAESKFGGDTQLSKEEAKNAKDYGSTAIYH